MELDAAYWQGRRVYVTGAAGFLGSWLTQALLEKGATVVGLIRDESPSGRWREWNLEQRITVVRGDVADGRLDERVLREYEIQTVFHLAAQPIVGVANAAPGQTFHDNITGTWELLDACRRYGRAEGIVVASSDKAYGESAILPYREDLPTVSTHPYDVSKSCTDLLARSFAATFDLPITVSRCGNFYGGGDLQWSRIVPGTFRSYIRNERPILRSDGSLIRDYIYIADVVEAYLLLGARAGDDDVRGQAFNFGTEQPVSVLALVDLLQKIVDRPDLPPVIGGQVPHEIPIQYLSTQKARRVLGWQSYTTLEDGLRATYAWYHALLAPRFRDVIASWTPTNTSL